MFRTLNIESKSYFVELKSSNKSVLGERGRENNKSPIPNGKAADQITTIKLTLPLLGGLQQHEEVCQ